MPEASYYRYPLSVSDGRYVFPSIHLFILSLLEIQFPVLSTDKIIL